MNDNAAVYLNVVEQLNDDWRKMARARKRFDTRVYHLRTFEISLSPCLPRPLYDHDEYKAAMSLFPLPDDELRSISMSAFRAYILVYEMIMRQYGMVGSIKKAGDVRDNVDTLSIFLPGAMT